MVEISKIRIKDSVVIGKQNAKVLAKIYIDGNVYVMPEVEVPIDEDFDVSWNLTQDVDDGTGYHHIVIELYYKDILNKEKPLDINGQDADKETGKNITLDYYLGNRVGSRYPAGGGYKIEDGSDDGNDSFLFDEKDARIYFRIVTVAVS